MVARGGSGGVVLRLAPAAPGAQPAWLDPGAGAALEGLLLVSCASLWMQAPPPATTTCIKATGGCAQAMVDLSLALNNLWWGPPQGLGSQADNPSPLP